MKVKDVSVKFKAGPADGLADGEFLVYPSTFIRKPDAYGDVVAKGAFAETIAQWKESGNTLPGLYGHRMDDPDFFVAGAADMGEDDHGWWVKGAFDLDSPKGPQVYRLVKGGRLNQLSFAFDVLEEGVTDLGDGETANELRKLKVYEFSFVPVGANQDTSVVAVKAITDSLVQSVKDGRAVAATIDSLRSVQEAIGAAIVAAGGIDQEKASGEPKANSGAGDEEPPKANSPAPDEEPKASPSAARLAAQANIYALSGQEGVPS